MIGCDLELCLFGRLNSDVGQILELVWWPICLVVIFWVAYCCCASGTARRLSLGAEFVDANHCRVRRLQFHFLASKFRLAWEFREPGQELQSPLAVGDLAARPPAEGRPGPSVGGGGWSGNGPTRALGVCVWAGRGRRRQNWWPTNKPKLSRADQQTQANGSETAR